jgi:hypothetical protein
MLSAAACVCAQPPAGNRITAIAAASGIILEIRTRHKELLAIFCLPAGLWGAWRMQARTGPAKCSLAAHVSAFRHKQM